MAFGFPARTTSSRTFNLQQDELVAVVKAVLAELDWSYKVLWGKDFIAYPPHGNWSWGEEVQIETLPGGMLKVQSKSKSYRMWFDFGKNRKNIETFFAHVEQMKGR
jgi:hypothetical protein